jgi:hypothetical protein
MFRVLIAYADGNGLPTQLQTQLLSEPGIMAADIFNAGVITPSLILLQQYDIVVPFSISPFADGATLGNNLADYVDGGGIVIQHGISFYGPNQPYGINGRWLTGGYSPYTYSANISSSTRALGAFNAAHPLMEGVGALQSNFHNIVTLAVGASQVAAWNNGDSLIATKAVGGHTTVGVTAYLGHAATWSGNFPRIIANAGRWLIPGCAIPTPRPSSTPKPRPTPGNTPPPTPRPSATPKP